MSEHLHKAGAVTRRARRKLAQWAAPEVDAELRRTQRQLRASRRKLREARAQLDAVSYGLSDSVEATIGRARAEHLTYLKPGDLRELASSVVELERSAIPGLVIEAGAARGGSAIVMAAAKAAERPMKVYDVFGMIPPPTEQDGPDVHARYAKIAAGEAKGVGGDTYSAIATTSSARSTTRSRGSECPRPSTTSS